MMCPIRLPLPLTDLYRKSKPIRANLDLHINLKDHYIALLLNLYIPYETASVDLRDVL
jgi:hypothetical protein